MKKFIAALGGCLILTLLAVSIHNAYLLNDYKNSTSTSKVEILIQPGETGSQIARKLREAGVIKAEKVFYKIAINDKRAKSISPGMHQIDLQISASSALEQLLDPNRNLGIFGFIEGLRKNEILDLLKKSNLVSGKYSGSTKISSLYKTNNIEGFLFPAQYSIYPGTTFDQAIPNSQLPIPNSQFPTPNSQLPIPNSQFPLPSSDFRLPTSDFRLPTSHFPTPNSQLPIPNSQFPIQHRCITTPLPSPTSAIPTGTAPRPYETLTSRSRRVSGWLWWARMAPVNPPCCSI